jgi:ribosomal protein S18 acetylase RimI-like enzyme
MSENLIFKFSELSVLDQNIVAQEIGDIFFETSTKKTFATAEEKEKFHYKYVGYYLEHYPELIWIARRDRTLGYILGSPQSTQPELLKIQPHLEKFKGFFTLYPAHLHINLSAASQGLGLGSKLVAKLKNELESFKIHGLHIMTGPESENRLFYQKLGFTFQVEKDSILFMGLPLS